MFNYKKWFLRVLLTGILLPAWVFGALSEEVRKSLLKDLEVIRTVFAVQYAPREWKGFYKNWNLDAQINQAINEVKSMQPLTIKGYQRTIKKFFQSPADYHVGVDFYSTEQSVIPFTVRGALGRYFIVEIDRNALPKGYFPAEVGDEILSFGDRPIAEVINELKNSDFTQSILGTDQALAELSLTMRLGAKGFIVPKGKVNMVTRNKTGIKNNFTVEWFYVPEYITELGSSGNNRFFAKRELLAKKDDPIHRFLDKQMVYGDFYLSQLSDTKQASYQIGAAQSYIPVLGIPFWKSPDNSTFYSYMFMQSGKRVGYIRIPHYTGGEQEAEEFKKIIKIMNLNTDLLVIDQVNNPGGSLFYVYALASMLTPYPLSTPRHNIAITQDDMVAATSYKRSLEDVKDTPSAQQVLGKTFGGYPVTYEFAQKTLQYADLIISEWNAGNQVTKPTFMVGVDDIQPNPDVQYSKTIVLLINQLDFSGGDFFPEIMKRGRRAILLGTRTAGAGGYVEDATFSNLGGIKGFTITSSIARKGDQTPLENNGVTPDVTIDLTVNDLQNNGIDMKNAILRFIDGIPIHR